MIRFVIALSTLSFLITSCASTKESSIFKELKADPIEKKLSNFLIGGIGTAASRIFLEQLANNIRIKFNDRNVNATYHYLGADISIARTSIKKIQTTEFDAILIFSPKDTSLFEVVPDRNFYPLNDPVTGPVNMTRNRQVIQYYQNFYALLYLQENKNRSVWNALISVNYDLRSQSLPKKLTRLIYDSFQSNNYIR